MRSSRNITRVRAPQRFSRVPTRPIAAAAAALPLLLGACELREVTIADPADIIVVEVVLRAGDTVQTAVLQRTGGPADSPAPPPAVLEVRAATGELLRYSPTPNNRCFHSMGRRTPAPIPANVACYAAGGENAVPVVEGRRYELNVRFGDGRELGGVTVVPSEFQLRSPPESPFEVEANSPLTLAWTPSDNAWAYLAEARFEGLRDALQPLGTDVPEDPLTLTGLAIGRADTTMILPGGFGLFDRFDGDLLPTLIALQQGIPDGVAVDLLIAAVDRNYVNWLRGGNFNPSGQVQVPSVFGDGTGVFGSLVLRRARVQAGEVFQVRGDRADHDLLAAP